MVENQKYGDLLFETTKNREAYAEESLIYYDIIIQSVINNPEKSNELIKSFYSKFATSNDTVTFYIIEAELNNYFKLFNYKKTLEISKKLLADFSAFYDSTEYADIKEGIVIDSLLQNEIPTSIAKIEDCFINIKKDIAGKNQLPVTGENDTTVNFIFDTGATVNVVTQTTAKKLNLKMIPNSSIKVFGGTGVANESSLAIADKIFIGNIEIRNAIFVVFADSLFSFYSGQYQINGIVGFPIFNLFEEIALTDSTAFIPKDVVKKNIEPNLFTFGPTCIISLDYKNQKFPFFFDTGFSTTYFYKNFYDIDSINFCKLEDTHVTIQGIGGYKTMKAKTIPEVDFICADKKFRFTDALIQLEYNPQNEKMNGNLGKDFMNQYEKRILSFKNAYIYFE